jgi:hypothetical protein
MTLLQPLQFAYRANTSNEMSKINPEIGEYETHPRTNNPQPHENSVALAFVEELTVACRYDAMGTFDSILDADVAVFCLEEPQKDLLKELLYVIGRTDKHLMVLLTNKLLYGDFIPPHEDHESRAPTSQDMEHIPEPCRTFIDFLHDTRPQDEYNILVSEPHP